MRLLFVCFLFGAIQCFGQQHVFHTSNLHAHNDYLKPFPFYDAFNKGFGSIETDIFLKEGKLLVAHSAAELDEKRTLESMYLQPLDSILRVHHNYLSADTSRRLQLLVDIKTQADSTLNVLIDVLKKYPHIISSRKLQIVISGNRPAVETFHSFPAFIFFDGLANQQYSEAASAKVPLISENFKNFTKWKGDSLLSAADESKIRNVIQTAHQQKRKIRFWNTADNEIVWRKLIELGVDLINTDKYTELTEFLKTKR